MAMSWAEKSIPETVTMWKNALTLLDDPKKESLHKAAQVRLLEIEAEWDRRRELNASANEPFRWPSTEVDGGSGQLNAQGWLKEGVLGALGYHVGDSASVPTLERRRILRRAFHGALPPVVPPADLEEWGAPASPKRLEKMARTIASHVRNSKRRADAHTRAVAIAEWEADLAFLHDTYFAPMTSFSWPSVDT
jgi:hypothetical protein